MMNNYREHYIEQLEIENRDLVGEMYECTPFSDKWMRLRSELHINHEEIEIMKQIETASAVTETASQERN